MCPDARDFRRYEAYAGSARRLASDLEMIRRSSSCDEIDYTQPSTDRECPLGAGAPAGERTMNSNRHADVRARRADRRHPLLQPTSPDEAMFALGFAELLGHLLRRTAARLGLAPAEVVDVFDNFAPGEVADTFRRCGAPPRPKRRSPSPGGLREGVAADPRRSRRRSGSLAPLTVDEGRDQRTVRGPADVRALARSDAQ